MQIVQQLPGDPAVAARMAHFPFNSSGPQIFFFNSQPFYLGLIFQQAEILLLIHGIEEQFDAKAVGQRNFFH